VDCFVGGVMKWLLYVWIGLCMVLLVGAVPKFDLNDVDDLTEFSVLPNGKVKLCNGNKCLAKFEVDSGDSATPILCLRKNGLCNVNPLNETFFLKKRNCDTKKNGFCDIQYLVRIK